MEIQLQSACKEATYLRLIEYLVESFPARKNFDYFALCQADPLCTSLPDHALEAFDNVSAFIEILKGESLITADHFRDGGKVYYSNAAFTPEGYRRATSLLKGRPVAGDTDGHNLILDFCFPDRPEPCTVNWTGNT